ncbi:MAG: hypothetical protein U0Y82_02415 [Thermoleophilia bacterium]
MLCAHVMRRRCATLDAALAGADGWSAEDRQWAVDAADSLGRLAGHVGRGDGTAHRLREVLGPGGDAAVAAGLLRELRDTLPDEVIDGPVDFELVAAAARSDAARAAAVRGVPVAVDITGQDGLRLDRHVAGTLVDALGRVVWDAVLHGTPDGGAIRAVAHADRDVVIVVVGDRGAAADAGVAAGAQLDGAREAGLRAAGGWLAAVGGEVSVGVGAWGGASVTLRAPLWRGPVAPPPRWRSPGGV